MKLALPPAAPGDAHHQREVADQAVADPEDDRPQRPGPPAGAMPGLPSTDLRRAAGAPGDRNAIAARIGDLADVLMGLEPVPDLGVLPFVGGDPGDLGRGLLGVVGLLLVTLERLHQLGDGRGPEQAGGEHDEPDAHPRTVGGRDSGPELP